MGSPATWPGIVPKCFVSCIGSARLATALSFAAVRRSGYCPNLLFGVPGFQEGRASARPLGPAPSWALAPGPEGQFMQLSSSDLKVGPPNPRGLIGAPTFKLGQYPILGWRSSRREIRDRMAGRAGVGEAKGNGGNRLFQRTGQAGRRTTRVARGARPR